MTPLQTSLVNRAITNEIQTLSRERIELRQEIAQADDDSARQDSLYHCFESATLEIEALKPLLEEFV